MEPRSSVLTDSYYRCRHNGGFLDSFYNILLAKSPAISRMFEKTNFKLQKLMLRQSLLEMICFDLGMKGTGEEIKRLGKLHDELGVTTEMYEMWVDSLCEAIRTHDPECTPQLEQHWREAMDKSIQAMIAVADTDD